MNAIGDSKRRAFIPDCRHEGRKAVGVGGQNWFPPPKKKLWLATCLPLPESRLRESWGQGVKYPPPEIYLGSNMVF